MEINNLVKRATIYTTIFFVVIFLVGINCGGEGYPVYAGPVIEICNDGVDNDVDGDIDCADTDCNTKPCDLDGNPCTGDRCLSVGGLPGSCVAGSNICGGLVPCGRIVNDPSTSWNDTDPCDFCHLLMLMSEIINFLIALAATITLLALVITGFLFITSAGNEERRTSAKRAFKMTLIGFIVIFMSWLMIDFLLTAWGYLDPLGGEWNVVCD